MSHFANCIIWHISLYVKYTTMINPVLFSLQMVEHGGFYRTSDQTWVKLERIQFVGACNPPTDPGRKPLTHRYTHLKQLFNIYEYQIFILLSK